MDRLFLQRARAAWESGFRYAILASGGNAIGMILAVSFAALLYKKLLEWIPDVPHSALGLSAVLAAWIIPSSIRTFLKEADLALLIPSGYSMRAYLQSAYPYSLLVRGLRQVPLLLLLYPLYVRLAPLNASWALFVIGLLLTKGWNVDLEWRLLRLSSQRLEWRSIVLRWLASALFLYGLWNAAWLCTGIAAIGMLIATSSLFARRSHYRLPWMRLVEQEHRQVESYYALLNGFVDVPYERQRVRSRRGLVYILDRLVHSRSDAAAYVLIRSMVRSGETLGLFVRFVAVAALILYAVESRWSSAAVLFIALVMAGQQLAHHLRANVRTYPASIRLLPIHSGQLRLAIRQLCFTALTGMSIVLGVVLFLKPGNCPQQLAMALAGFLWGWLVSVYAGRAHPFGSDKH